jgi:hypothetical protein
MQQPETRFLRTNLVVQPTIFHRNREYERSFLIKIQMHPKQL